MCKILYYNFNPLMRNRQKTLLLLFDSSRICPLKAQRATVEDQYRLIGLIKKKCTTGIYVSVVYLVTFQVITNIWYRELLRTDLYDLWSHFAYINFAVVFVVYCLYIHKQQYSLFAAVISYCLYLHKHAYVFLT